MSEQRDAAFMAVGMMRSARISWENADLRVPHLRDEWRAIYRRMNELITEAWTEIEKLPQSEE